MLAVLVLSGCGSDSSGTAAAPSNAGSLAQDSNLGNTGNGKAAADVAEKTPGAEVQRRAVISTGTIALTSERPRGDARRLDAVLAKDGGRVADEATATDDHGR